MNDCITTTKQSTTKPCAYFLGYTVDTAEPTNTGYIASLNITLTIIDNWTHIFLICN